MFDVWVARLWSDSVVVLRTGLLDGRRTPFSGAPRSSSSPTSRKLTLSPGGMMRKIAMIAVAVTALFGVVAIAQASNTYTVTVATVSPKKAGTALKPKPITINFGYEVGETTPGTRPATTTD